MTVSFAVEKWGALVSANNDVAVSIIAVMNDVQTAAVVAMRDSAVATVIVAKDEEDKVQRMPYIDDKGNFIVPLEDGSEAQF
jgi:hypothetical protein